MSIYIFCGPVHSGKTSRILQWCAQQKNIAGVLMPDIDGSRKILDLETKILFDIECTDTAHTTEPLTVVGRFYFFTAAFEKANAIIIQALAKKPGWLVIDEAGKLELEGKGFFPSIEKAVSFYNDDKTPGHLLLTVRENLCDEVITFFNIQNCRVIHNTAALT